MKYRSDPTLPSVSQYSRRDEVTVFQAAKDGSAWIVFRGFLKIGGKIILCCIFFRPFNSLIQIRSPLNPNVQEMIAFT